MIKLTKLSMKNFLSHVDTEIVLHSYDGLTLIEGKTLDGRYSSNGSGKSTIIEGIYYAFTGKTLRGLTTDSVVNRGVGKDTCVSLEFYCNGLLYKIERYRKHTQLGNDLKLYKDGEDISSRTPTDTQSIIDQLIEIPNEILSGIMIMGEGLSSRFTQLSDPDKKRLLEGTIRLSHNIDNAREETKSRLRDVDSKITYNKGLLDAHEGVKSSQRALQNTDITQVEDALSDYREQLNGVEQELSSKTQQIEPINNKIGVLDKAIHEYDQLISSRDSNDKCIQDLESKLQDVMRDVPVCPLCHQVLKDPTEIKDHLNAELEGYKRKRIDYDVSIHKIPDITTMKSKREELSNQLRGITSDQMRLNSEKTKLQSFISECVRTIDGYAKSDEIIRKLDEEDSVLNEELTSLSKEKERLEYISKSIFAPTGVIVNILSGVVDYVDQRLQVYTNLLLDKVFHLTFKKGKISLESVGNTYQSLSNGEKRRLDISIQFAMHDYIYTHCGIGFDTMFIDEVLDTLDSVGVTNIIEVLNMKRVYCSMDRIFIVTHNDELKEYFDSVLSVSKDANGITTIV